MRAKRDKATAERRVGVERNETDPVCLGCGDSFTVEPDHENDGWCHPCAHRVLDMIGRRLGPRVRDYRSAVECGRSLPTS